jgi:hypothetical protein
MQDTQGMLLLRNLQNKIQSSMKIEKLSKKELVPIAKSPLKEIKSSHQGPTSRHLSQSMKNSESIKRAMDT